MDVRPSNEIEKLIVALPYPKKILLPAHHLVEEESNPFCTLALYHRKIYLHYLLCT